MIIATLSSPPSTRDYSACAISAAHPASAAFNPSPQRQILKSDALSQVSSLPPPLRLGPPRLLAPLCVAPLRRRPLASLPLSSSSPPRSSPRGARRRRPLPPPPLDAAVVPFHRCPDAAAHTSPSSPSTAGAAVFPIGHTNRAMATHKIPHAWTTKAPSR